MELFIADQSRNLKKLRIHIHMNCVPRIMNRNNLISEYRYNFRQV